MKIEIKVRTYDDPGNAYLGTDVAETTLTVPDGLLPAPVIAQLGAKVTKVVGELVDDAIQTTGPRRGVQVISVDMADIRKALEHPAKVEAEEVAEKPDPELRGRTDAEMRDTVASKAH